MDVRFQDEVADGHTDCHREEDLECQEAVKKDDFLKEHPRERARDEGRKDYGIPPS
jgi:hypothetical protein